MKITALLVSTLTLLLPSAVQADGTPPLFDLTSSTDGLEGMIWNNVMYSGGSAYLGDIKYATTSEPLLRESPYHPRYLFPTAC